MTHDIPVSHPVRAILVEAGLPPPRLMRDFGYAHGHDVKGAFFGQNRFPDGMYCSADRGFRHAAARRRDRWAKLRQGRA